MHMPKKFNKILLILMVLAFAFTLTACGGNKDTSSEGTVTVGGKEFTEQDIMVHLVSELIEANRTNR